MQIAPDQATLLQILVSAIGARWAVEVGTFTGLSALAIARGLPVNGRLFCFDVSEEWTAIGRRYWEKAGVADRIELRIGPAAPALRALPEEPWLDFAFIDADKSGYPVYWDEIVRRLRPGGLVAVDNVLWEGEVGRLIGGWLSKARLVCCCKILLVLVFVAGERLEEALGFWIVSGRCCFVVELLGLNLRAVRRREICPRLDL